MIDNRFEAFMQGDCNHKKIFEPGATAYIIWNLSRNTSYVKQEGLAFIPENMRYSCTLDAYREFCMTMIEDEDDIERISHWTRDNLLACFMENRPIPSLDINYHVANGWIHTHTEGYLMRHPETGDIYLKAQNTNDTTYAAFERLMAAITAESYEAMIYIDAESGVFVAFSSRFEKRQATEFVLSEELERLSALTGLKGDSVEAFIEDCLERTKTNAKTIWFLEGKVIIKRVTLQHIFEGSKQFVLYVADVSEEVFRHRKEQEEQKHTRSFLDALSSEYLGVQEVDLDNDKITSYRLYVETPFDIQSALEGGSYEEVRKLFLKTLVRDEYIELALEISSPDYIRKRLRKTSSFSTIVRSVDDHYLEIKRRHSVEQIKSLWKLLCGKRMRIPWVRWSKALWAAVAASITRLTISF